MAANIIELLIKIRSKPIKINKKRYPISPECEDVLMRMLMDDPTKRISWEELFEHPINYYRENKVK